MKSIKILLLQARDPGDLTIQEERQAFANKAGLNINQFVLHDLLAGPPSLKKVLNHQALMVGGSGNYYVSKQNLPYFNELLDLLRAVVDKSHPTFASCFGFQLLTKALGGEIVYDADNTEIGTYQLQLTAAGQQDPLFKYLPPYFEAQLGHSDKATTLPPNCIHLASSKRCPYQAFAIPNKPIWATQFHPELSLEENLLRLQRYLENYKNVLGPEKIAEITSHFHESPETLSLIPRFLKLVL